MPTVAYYEEQLQKVIKQKEGLKAEAKQLKAKLSKAKRSHDNHVKMVLGGAIFGLLEEKIPADRKELRLYGFALKNVLQKDKARLIELIDNEFMNLMIEEEKKEQEKKLKEEQEKQEENNTDESEPTTTGGYENRWQQNNQNY